MLVLINGGIVSIDSLIEPCHAIVEAFNPGQRGALGLYLSLFGQANRWGRLPVTIYPLDYTSQVGRVPVDLSTRHHHLAALSAQALLLIVSGPSGPSASPPPHLSSSLVPSTPGGHVLVRHDLGPRPHLPLLPGQAAVRVRAGHVLLALQARVPGRAFLPPLRLLTQTGQCRVDDQG